MALWLVLKDFNSGVPGTTEFISAATILNDGLVNVPALQAAGCPMFPWTATAPQVAARNAFLSKTLSGQGGPIYSENMLDLLVTFGATGGGGVSGSVEQFTFRPGAPDNPAMGIYGTWASLMAEVAIPAAVGIAFVVVVDYSILLANFVIPAGAWAFGGNAIIRGTPAGAAFNLQADGAITSLSGIAAFDNFITFESIGAGAVAPIQAPGLSLLYITRGSLLTSSSGGGAAAIDVPANSALFIALQLSGSVANGGAAAVRLVTNTSTLAFSVADQSSLGNTSVIGVAGSTLAIQKGSSAAKIPATLVGFGGTLTLAGQLYSIPHASYGVQTVPLAAGAYFVPYGGNDAVVVATAQDQPFVEFLPFGSRPRLLAVANLWAVLNSGIAAVVTVECLLNGVLVPGMVNAGIDLNTLATTPIQLSATNPPRLATGDKVSIRVTVPGGGIAATCTDLFCVIETV